uniref:NFACT RNA-binding domain-containing protein n=1 Tax=Odontella aurita TaxID=265563 RepID=A0A6U6DJ37_9STRA|mmetsp:Transcript_20998/g.61095  ORF Transcript_20998/g.61095 Transcript_20998/m.61095 type:complete len:215 (+) Transcript_20998:214-858(+)|eukprot:CAMPEP_0113553672 /NCGR_PEP_ID=MMETSP0015_2-20120614/15740_1 /TAXON_ID=2838 /ORGANISM="Odontella" /LENGTH=214 /DNA_ID=CAMNT_0000454761 /DNA_START=212 /DNA_END=856 /DNA_ORIENTATION=+ /assembly_acc=CAM_ASM_000160
MVFYFSTRCGNFMLYMGKDKYENEDLIKFGQPEDVWFHVDDLSSAHVYLRMKPGMTLSDIPPDAILECAALVKANSIQGCKMKSVYVVYTRWKNLKKTSQMVDGQVGFHRPENVKRMEVEKHNPIVNALNKTKEERHPDLYKEQQDRLREIQEEKKANRRAEEKARKQAEAEEKKEKERLSYNRIMKDDNMTSNAERTATADATAAEEYEEDFF